jgi:cobalt-zinc-cadmium efflux system outer membrane protein
LVQADYVCRAFDHVQSGEEDPLKNNLVGALMLACLCAGTTAQAYAQDREKTAELRLDEVIRLAVERSPEVEGAQHTIRAMEHRVPQARTLPDPSVSVGWAGKPVPFDTMSGDASSYRGFTVSELFPYPGKLRLQGEMAKRDVTAAQADCEASRRRVVLGARLAFAEYFYLDKAIEATQRNKELLEKLAQIAEAQYRVGKAMQPDVLRAQLEISMLMEKLTVLEQQRDTAITDLNAALQQAPETPMGKPAPLEQSRIGKALGELYALAEAHDTGLERGDATIERGKLGVALAERQRRPDVNVSYMFQQRTNQPAMHGVTVSVTVPVFQKSRQQEAIAEAAESLAAAGRMQANQRTAVRAEVRRQYVAAQAAERLLTLYAKGIVPQSALTLESAMSAYQVGKGDFNSVIGSFSAELNYETGYYRQLADHEIAVARIEALTGEPITTDSAQASTESSDSGAAKGAL